MFKVPVARVLRDLDSSHNSDCLIKSLNGRDVRHSSQIKPSGLDMILQSLKKLVCYLIQRKPRPQTQPDFGGRVSRGDKTISS